MISDGLSSVGAPEIDGATLTMTWELNIGEGHGATLNLRWIERGVPVMPVDPHHAGFGRELIEEALPYRINARTVMDFRGGGLRCSISFPLDRAIATSLTRAGRTAS